MSRFEFIFVLISIVAGLALTRLLSGLTLTLRRSEQKIDIAHVLFSLGIIVLLFGIWWTSFRWEQLEIWTYLEYSLICVYMSMFYVLAVILHPHNSPTVPRFNEIRTPFYVTFILYTIVEILLVTSRDGEFAIDYFIMVFIQCILLGLGIYLRNIRFDQFLAAWIVFTAFGWQLYARFVG